MIKLLKKTLYKNAEQSGQSLIELLIAMGLTAILLPALLTGYIASENSKPNQLTQLQASQLVEEADSAVRSVRDSSWNNIGTNGIYHPVVSSGKWTLVPGPETINNITRSISIQNAYTDNNGNFASSGTFDPSAKQITTVASWSTPYNENYSNTFYLTRYIGNTTYTENTINAFNSGIFTNTQISNNQIILSPLGPGQGDWCSPNIADTLNLPKNGQARQIYAIPGEAFVDTGTTKFGASVEDISVPDTNPPTASIIQTISGYTTNNVFGDNNYIYIATSNNKDAVSVISKSTNSQIAYFYPGGGKKGSNANTIYVAGNIGYTTIGNILYTFDLSNKSGMLPELGQTTLKGDATGLIINNNYAYVSINSNSNQLQILNISPDGKTITPVSSISITALGALNLFVSSDGSRAYLITANSTTPGWNEFFIINTVNKQSPFEIGSYNEPNNVNPTDLSIVLNGNRALISSTGNEDYQVLNIQNESNPVLCAHLSGNNGTYGIASVVEPDNTAYAYVTSGLSIGEFRIISGGPGGNYAKTGSFESQAFNAGSNVEFNRLYLNFNQPSGTSITYQVAVARAINGTCNNVNYTFVGPGGNTNQYFTNDNSIPMGNFGNTFQNPGQCFKYKIYFTPTSNLLISPSFSGMTVNYSP